MRDGKMQSGQFVWKRGEEGGVTEVCRVCNRRMVDGRWASGRPYAWRVLAGERHMQVPGTKVTPTVHGSHAQGSE